MVLKLANDEVPELRRALSARYSEVLQELSRAETFSGSVRAQQLCRMKWKLEALLHQLEHPELAPPVLELVPADRSEIVHKEAA